MLLLSLVSATTSLALRTLIELASAPDETLDDKCYTLLSELEKELEALNDTLSGVKSDAR